MSSIGGLRIISSEANALALHRPLIYAAFALMVLGMPDAPRLNSNTRIISKSWLISLTIPYRLSPKCPAPAAAAVAIGKL